MHTAGLHQRTNAFMGVHRSSGVHVEKAHLVDDCGTDEISGGSAGNLWTNFQTIAAGDAGGKLVRFFLSFRSDARPLAEIVSAVDGNPRFDAFQALKHELPVNSEIADYGKFRHRLQPNRLLQFINQRRTSHACFAVDEHRARAADFFQAIGVVRNWSGFFAVTGYGISRDVAQADDRVHRGPPGQREFFPVLRALRAYLSLNFYDDLSFRHKSLPNRLLSSLARLNRSQDDSFFKSRARSDQAHRHFTASYLRGRGVICEMSTGS